MTKALCSFPQPERFHVAKRRVASKSGGLGYLGAKDAMVHFGKPIVVEVTTKADLDDGDDDDE